MIPVYITVGLSIAILLAATICAGAAVALTDFWRARD